ncbi:hypothetical protein WA158_007145 [Blastocystis sp. Blastoise]
MNKLELITVIIDVSKQYEKGFGIRDYNIHYTDNFITKQPSNYQKYIYSNLYSKEDRVETVCDKVNDYADNNIRAFVATSHVKGGYALSPIEEYIGKKFWFTMKTNLFFLYENRTDQFIDFETNNGLWVFINKHLFLDYGGYNTPVGSHINITNYADKLGLIPGITYSISIFFASRTCRSINLLIQAILLPDKILDISSCDHLVTPSIPPLIDTILCMYLKLYVEASLYEYITVLQSLWADVNLGKDDILDVLFQQCLNTQTLRLSLFLLQHICTVILLTNKDIDIFYEAVHNNRIYEFIQATTIICQLLPLFPNQQREYLQSLLLNTCDNICTVQSIKKTVDFLTTWFKNAIYLNDGYKSFFNLLYTFEPSSEIHFNIMYTLLARTEEIMQITHCPSSYIPPQLHTLKKINSHSISFNMSHNSLEEVYSPPFPPPPPTNYFTGAYKDIENDLMDDNDMEVPEEEEIGLMNTYEEKERGEGEEKPIGELIYELNYILNTVEIEGEEETGKKKEKEMIDIFTYIGKGEEEDDHSIDVQYAYSLLRNRLKTVNKEEKYDVNMILAMYLTHELCGLGDPKSGAIKGSDVVGGLPSRQLHGSKDNGCSLSVGFSSWSRFRSFITSDPKCYQITQNKSK